ncbi:MAG TPA: NUDIX hydrolase [Solirubrobacteraceae bacterium]|nr:NUDIX hydrolase [Solirubrobacteraceae bacterium]
MGQTQDSPAPGEELNTGAATTPRQAASVMLLRDHDEQLEVLLVKRTPKARFMGGVWVFPGGAVDAADAETPSDRATKAQNAEQAPGDSATETQSAQQIPSDGTTGAQSAEQAPGGGEGDRAHRIAALRELREEAGVTLASPEELVEFSRWITPAAITVRFDTRFFLARLPTGEEPVVDGEECVDLGWFSPQAALAAHEQKQIELVFPTIKQLEHLRVFPTATALLEHAAGAEVLPVEPRVFFDGEFARILLPGEPGYEQA